MLNNIAETIKKATRKTVLNHPNSWACVIAEKKVRRKEGETLGGLAVLDSEDEEDFAFESKGAVSMLFVSHFQRSSVFDNANAVIGDDEIHALIYHQAIGNFEIKKHDIIFITIGADPSKNVNVAYEVVDRISPIGISPYAQVFSLNRRSSYDLK